VVKATDEAQNVVWDAVRKPFGERTVAVAEVAVLLGFPGQYFDDETGNYYNYFRDYDPGTGRYLQSDPIGLDGGINIYAYVKNNPLAFIDPTGKAPLCSPGQRGVPLHGYENSYPNVWDCKPYPENRDKSDSCISGCEDPVTITWTSGLPDAPISPPVTKQYSLKCLLSFGLIKAGGSSAFDKGINFAKQKAAQAGMNTTAGALGLATSPPGQVAFGTIAISEVFEQCECEANNE
jgi:RHS repeat-associated protein